VNNNDFREKITLKPYSKYLYQSILKGPKPAKKEAFLKAINNFKNHLYDEYLLKKRGFCFFCSKKSNLNPSKKGRNKQIFTLFNFTVKQRR
jgi:hypothetical protein